MIFIDLENRLPTDADLPEDVRWKDEEWNAWLAKSKALVKKLAELDSPETRKEKNELIDRNKDHWGLLKPWLLALSDGKCWFSEVRELFSHYDVEHFRPKKEARELGGIERDGYWWLSFDYKNFRVCGNVGNRKKGGWFPLKPGSLCSTYVAQCEESETRYFLDPIDVHDVSLIASDEEGKVIPAPEASDWEKERVKETVSRLKLNEHVPLAEERRKIWQKLDRLIKEFYTAKARSADGTNPVAAANLRNVGKRIREMTGKNAELSSVARWCLLLRNDRQILRLVG